MLERWAKNLAKAMAWMAFDILGWMMILFEIVEGKLWRGRAKSAIRSGRAMQCVRCGGVVLPSDEAQKTDDLVWHVENAKHFFIDGPSRRRYCYPKLSDERYGEVLGGETYIRPH